MILSNVDILKYLNNNNLKINSFNSDNLRSSSYCLSLSNEIIKLNKTNSVIKLSNKDTYPSSEKLIISDKKPYIIEPGEFLLASSIETISISNGFTGFLSNISGLARLGLNVLLSTHVASGFGTAKERAIVFELHNLSKNHIELIPNIRICHLVFVSNNSPSSIGYDKSFPDKYKDSKLSEYFK